MSIEAMKLAIEALENAREIFISLQEFCIRNGVSAKDVRLGERFIVDRALDELRQAIAEAEKQEPVAWIDRTCLKNLSDDFEPTIGKRPVSEYDIPLYTHPQPKEK